MEFPSFTMKIWTFLLLLIVLLKSEVVYCNYLIGLGSYDITGPAADVNMMGYANAEQIASKGNRVVFVNLDACMASQLVTIKVLERLKAR
jgi:neutral ceramidase